MDRIESESCLDALGVMKSYAEHLKAVRGPSRFAIKVAP